MPLFALQENRYINTDHIAQISYTPNFDSVSPGASKPMIELGSQPASNLTIQFLSKDVPSVHLEGKEADAAWTAFKLSQQRPPHNEQVSLNPDTHNE